MRWDASCCGPIFWAAHRPTLFLKGSVRHRMLGPTARYDPLWVSFSCQSSSISFRSRSLSFLAHLLSLSPPPPPPPPPLLLLHVLVKIGPLPVLTLSHLPLFLLQGRKEHASPCFFSSFLPCQKETEMSFFSCYFQWRIMRHICIQTVNSPETKDMWVKTKDQGHNST